MSGNVTFRGICIQFGSFHKIAYIIELEREMLKLQTPVECGRSPFTISYRDRIMVLGSCFADNAGRRMAEAGLDVCVNPFGTLYNPQSICNSVERLENGTEFTAGDCEMMGSGAGLVCSFSHHTSFARQTEAEFLENANGRLREAAEFYRQADIVVITLGTSWCYRHIGKDIIVSNCLKRNAKEFVRERLEPEQTFNMLSKIISGKTSGKKIILTVSPIRHLKDGAHGNAVSKASLLLAAERLYNAFPDRCTYFPAYEIMTDELRDYRFYAEDMVHPSEQAVRYIWERFCDFALADEDRPLLAAKEKEFRQSQHRKMH